MLLRQGATHRNDCAPRSSAAGPHRRSSCRNSEYAEIADPTEARFRRMSSNHHREPKVRSVFDSSANTRESSLGVYSVMRRLQLWSGVVLLTYLLMHLTNHALGIWSLELAGRGLEVALRLWRSTPGTIALYGAALAHFSLALRTIYGRRRWVLPAAEWIRLWAGLSLPLLLIRHAVTTRLASGLYGFEPNYERVSSCRSRAAHRACN